jgi:hypothetical protein
MTIFPFMAKPMLEANLGISADQFNDFIEQRKKEIPAFIISALRP